MSAWSLQWRWFLPVFLFISFCYAFLIPPFQVPDEYMHFGRAITVSQGQLRAVKQDERLGYLIDCSAAKLMQQMPRTVEFRTEGRYDWQTFHTLDTESAQLKGVCFWEIDRGSLQMHVPYLYLPQAAGILLAKVFSAKPSAWLYTGRLFNLAVCALLLLLAFRWHTGSKLRFAFYLTLPMFLHLLASLSGDAVAITLALVFYSRLLAALQQSEPGSRAWLVLGATALFLGIAKSVYFPLLLLLFLLPVKTKERRDWLFATFFFIATLMILFSWNMLVRGDYYSTEIYGMDPARQVQYLLQHPLRGAMAIMAGLIVNAHKIAVTYFGLFGWLSVIMPAAWYVAYFLLLIVVLLAEKDFPDETGNLTRWGFLLVALGVIALLSLVMYISFTPVGAAYTKGLQGRHLMPVLPVLLAAVGFRTTAMRYLSSLSFCVLPMIAVMNLIALFVIWRQFYHGG